MRQSQPKFTQVLGACGLFAVIFYLLADGLGIYLTPGYSLTSQAISELMEKDAPYKHVVDSLLLAYHGLVIPFAWGLHRVICDEDRNPLGPLLLAVAGGAGVILTLFFPCDPGCEPFVSVRGTAHIFLAILMGFAVLFAILGFSFRLAKAKRWRRYTSYSRLTFGAGLLLATITVMMAETQFVGLFERILTATYLQWYVAMAYLMIRDSPSSLK